MPSHIQRTSDLFTEKDKQTLAKYEKRLENRQKLTKEESEELFKKARNGSEEAFEELLDYHLVIVISTAKQYSNYGLSLQLLVEIGINQIARRIFVEDNYDHFMSYLSWCIKQSMLQAIMK